MSRVITDKTANIKVNTRNFRVVFNCESVRATNLFEFFRETEIKQDGVVISVQSSKQVSALVSDYKDEVVTLNDGTIISFKQLNEALNKFGDSLEALQNP